MSDSPAETLYARLLKAATNMVNNAIAGAGSVSCEGFMELAALFLEAAEAVHADRPRSEPTSNLQSMEVPTREDGKPAAFEPRAIIPPSTANSSRLKDEPTREDGSLSDSACEGVRTPSTEKFEAGRADLPPVSPSGWPGWQHFIIAAAKAADWTQVVLNQGPPCFQLESSGRFCLRAQRWAGHTEKDEYPEHRFVSLADMIAALPAPPGEREATPPPTVEIIVNGQPVTVNAGPIRQVIADAIQQSGQIGAPVEQWVLRHTDGTIIPHTLPDATEYAVSGGQRLWLHLDRPARCGEAVRSTPPEAQEP